MLPKIGIRVIVDGRRNGVREKIEEPTFELAKSVKKLLEGQLFYPNGKSVECIISSVGIGGVKEACQVDEEFELQGVKATISISKAFAYAAEVMQMDSRIPQAIWGFNGSERPGSVYLAATTAVSDQKGIPVYKIYGQNVQDASSTEIPEDVSEKLLNFGRAAIALAMMNNKSYLSIGTVSMGIGSSIVDGDFFQSYLGMRNEAVDMSEIMRRLNESIFDKEELEIAREWTKKHCMEMADPNSQEIQQNLEEKSKVWDTVIKMTLIFRDLMVGNSKLEEMGYVEESCGHEAIAAGFQGQRQWTDFMPNGDFSEAILNSSFDWRGIREPYILATENDSLNAVTMLFGKLLTGTAQIFADVRTFWSPEALKSNVERDLPKDLQQGFIYLTNSGSAALDGTIQSTTEGEPTIKPFWEMKDLDVKNCLENTQWGAGKLATFRGGGFSSSFKSKGDVPITMMRLNLVKGLGPVLQIAEGKTITLPDDIEKIVISRTDPTWPKTFFVPRLTAQDGFDSVYEVMNRWGSNHCTFSYGHIGHLVITLAAMLRIPVCMHNIPSKRLFRPSSWNLFGGNSIEADFRACENFGPLYGKY